MPVPDLLSLDDLLDYVIASPTNRFTNKQALLDLFGTVEFSERFILGDDQVYFKSLVLHIGYWGMGTDKCWASMFGSKVLYYRDDNTVPSVPGDSGVVLTEVPSMSYQYRTRDGYYSKWQTPFSFVAPKVFSGSWEERTGKALELLNLLDHEIALCCLESVNKKYQELEEEAVMFEIQLSEALKHKRVLSDLQSQQDREIKQLDMAQVVMMSRRGVPDSDKDGDLEE